MNKTEYRISDQLLEAVKGFEGCRLQSYRCPAGKMTIGYGHTRGVKPGQCISQDQAEALLRVDLLPCVTHVNSLGVCRTQGQFDALVDFCFNLGTGALAGSTLLRKIRLGAGVKEIQTEFRRWSYSNGKRLPGLVKRREWEARRWAE